MITVPLSQIIVDNTFRYRLHTIRPPLQRSIEQQGILRPLSGVKVEAGVLLFDGFLRWELAREKPIDPVPVIVHPDKSAAFLESVYLNHSQEPLTVVEKAQALAVARTILSDKQQAALAEFLDIHTSRQVQLLREIATYPWEARQYFHDQQFSLKQIERLRSLKVEKLLPWIRLARELRMKAPEFQQIIEMVWDISVREDCSIEACYQQLGVEQFLQENWTVQQKVHHLKQMLFEKRYPVLHHLRQKLEQQARRIQAISPLPLRIQWDRNLEDMGIWLQFYLEDISKLPTLVTLLKNPEFFDSLKQYFEIFTQTEE